MSLFIYFQFAKLIVPYPFCKHSDNINTVSHEIVEGFVQYVIIERKGLSYLNLWDLFLSENLQQQI